VCIVYGVAKTTRHATYNLNYHIVWIPKFREPILEGQVARSEANDVVVEYDLSGYAKNALKKYVPQLVRDGTQELDDGHPVRFTNEGVRMDHKPQNALEWYAKYLTTRTTTSGVP
jgi:hypothetical protein